MYQDIFRESFIIFCSERDFLYHPRVNRGFISVFPIIDTLENFLPTVFGMWRYYYIFHISDILIKFLFHYYCTTSSKALAMGLYNLC